MIYLKLTKPKLSIILESKKEERKKQTKREKLPDTRLVLFEASEGLQEQTRYRLVLQCSYP